MEKYCVTIRSNLFTNHVSITLYIAERNGSDCKSIDYLDAKINIRDDVVHTSVYHKVEAFPFEVYLFSICTSWSKHDYSNQTTSDGLRAVRPALSPARRVCLGDISSLCIASVFCRRSTLLRHLRERERERERERDRHLSDIYMNGVHARVV